MKTAKERHELFWSTMFITTCITFIAITIYLWLKYIHHYNINCVPFYKHWSNVLVFNVIAFVSAFVILIITAILPERWFERKPPKVWEIDKFMNKVHDLLSDNPQWTMGDAVFHAYCKVYKLKHHQYHTDTELDCRAHNERIIPLLRYYFNKKEMKHFLSTNTGKQLLEFYT